MNPLAVFDTVVLLQAAANPDGPAGRCLRLVADSKLTLVMSAEGMAEITDVLSRDKVRRKFPQLSTSAVGVFLAGLRARARIVADVPAVFVYQRDPDDEHILDLVIAASVRFLVTRDRDLLDLARPESTEGTALLRLCSGLLIVDPVALLKALGPTGPPLAGTV